MDHVGLYLPLPKDLAKQYPTKGATIRDMHRCLINLEKSHKWRPDFIVLDYMGITKPRRQREKRYEEYLELSEDFRWLLGEWRVPGHTAAQLSRGGAKAHRAEGTDVAGMWDALATFDYIYILNQDDEERRDKEMRIRIDKARDGVDKVDVGPILTAWERMCFAVKRQEFPWEMRERLERAEQERSRRSTKSAGDWSTDDW